LTKIKLTLTVALLTTSLSAVELRVSKGSFDWDMSIAKFMGVSFDLDTNILSINEQHNNFSDTNIYYFYNADIYRSSFMDKITTMMSYPVRYDFPILGSFDDAVAKYTPIPVPSEYKIRGFDLNLGIGYDLVNNKDGFIGIGVNSGFSMPVMKMRNMESSAKLTYDVLDNTETKIMTYKLGPTIQGALYASKELMFYGSFSFGLQTGSIENDWIKSSMDVDGSYSYFDIGLKYTPWSTSQDFGWIRLDHKVYFTAGYSHKKWEMDEVKADMFNIFNVSSYGMFDSSFGMSQLYIGAGYDF
jgi:hypothetical protein